MRITNAYAEGITNKIKVIKRSAYGFRNFARFRERVLVEVRRGLTSPRGSGAGPRPFVKIPLFDRRSWVTFRALLPLFGG